MYNKLRPKDNFTIIRKIGKGSYGTVYKARSNTDSKFVAIKTIPVNTQKQDDIS